MYTYLSIYAIYIYIYTDTNGFTHMYIYIYTYIYTPIYTHTHIYIYIIYKNSFIYLFIHSFIYTYNCSPIAACAYMYTSPCVYKSVCAYTVKTNGLTFIVLQPTKTAIVILTWGAKSTYLLKLLDKLLSSGCLGVCWKVFTVSNFKISVCLILKATQDVRGWH